VPEHALLRGKSGDRPTVETGTAGAESVANPGGSAEHWQCASGGFNFREASRQSCGALEFFFSASAVQGGTTPTERE
jgi:hypothetical protein